MWSLGAGRDWGGGIWGLGRWGIGVGGWEMVGIWRRRKDGVKILILGIDAVLGMWKGKMHDVPFVMDEIVILYAC